MTYVTKAVSRPPLSPPTASTMRNPEIAGANGRYRRRSPPVPGSIGPILLENCTIRRSAHPLEWNAEHVKALDVDLVNPTSTENYIAEDIIRRHAEECTQLLGAKWDLDHAKANREISRCDNSSKAPLTQQHCTSRSSWRVHYFLSTTIALLHDSLLLFLPGINLQGKSIQGLQSGLTPITIGHLLLERNGLKPARSRGPLPSKQLRASKALLLTLFTLPS